MLLHWLHPLGSLNWLFVSDLFFLKIITMTLCKSIRLMLEIVSFSFNQNANMPMAMIRWYHCTPFLQKHSVLYKKSKSFRDVKHFIYLKTVYCYTVFAVHIFLLITFIFLDRSCDTLLANPATSLVFTAVGIIVFALWGFLPLMRDIRNRFDVCFCYLQLYLYDYILG